jgi:hypothetical protein
VPAFLWCQDVSGVSISDTRTMLVPEKGLSSSSLDPIVRERLVPEARWHQNNADTRSMLVPEKRLGREVTFLNLGSQAVRP